MKVIELLEYKNKYYKPVPKRPKARGNKTLWYNQYERWVGDIQSRYPSAKAYYDEENEEIFAGSDDCKECYGRWSKKNGSSFKGVTFAKPRGMKHTSRNAARLKHIEQPKKDDEEVSKGGGFSALF